MKVSTEVECKDPKTGNIYYFEAHADYVKGDQVEPNSLSNLVIEPVRQYLDEEDLEGFPAILDKQTQDDLEEIAIDALFNSLDNRGSAE